MKWLRWFWLFLILLLVFSFSFHTSQTSWQQDLGRHLKIGQIIWQNKRIPKTNLFSYTYSDFLFENHHWLGEVLFFLVYRCFSNSGLIFLKTIIFLTSFALIFKYFFPIKKLGLSVLLSLGVGLVFRQRSQIRPEIFGLLFFSLYLVIFKKAQKNRALLWWLVPLQILWVNIHLSFVFGLFLLGLELIKALFRHKTGTVPIIGRDRVLKTILPLAIAILGVLINPYFIRGALKPLLIWQNYGYQIAENQSILYLQKLFFNPNVVLFEISVLIVFATFIFANRLSKFEFLAWLILSVVAAWQIRHFPFWALYSFYCLGKNMVKINQRFSRFTKKINLPTAFVAGGLILFFTSFYLSGYYYRIHDDYKTVGCGGAQPAAGAAKFLKENFASQAIFNNFDIGSFLDWVIYPQMKVFADSRPEAFPASFWQQYRQAQQDWPKWQELQKHYHINVVFFSTSDQTPWGREFLGNLYQRKDWQLVYWDEYAVIFSQKSLPVISLEEIYQQSENSPRLAALGEFCQTVGEKELARKTWQKVLVKNPVSQKANIYLARYYRQSNNPGLRFKSQQLEKKLNKLWYKF